jgi:hypothetical protein
LFNLGAQFEKALVFRVAGKSHHVFDTGPVVPAAVEDDDLTGGWKSFDVALQDVGLAPEASVSRTTRHDRVRLRRTSSPPKPSLRGRTLPLEREGEDPFSDLFRVHPTVPPFTAEPSVSLFDKTPVLYSCKRLGETVCDHEFGGGKVVATKEHQQDADALMVVLSEEIGSLRRAGRSASMRQQLNCRFGEPMDVDEMKKITASAWEMTTKGLNRCSVAA